MVTGAGSDPPRDDPVFLAGLRTDLDVWPESAHAFTDMGTPPAALALRRTTGWIDALLETPAARP